MNEETLTKRLQNLLAQRAQIDEEIIAVRNVLQGIAIAKATPKEDEEDTDGDDASSM